MGDSYIQTDDGSVIEVKIIEEARSHNRVPPLSIERLDNNDDNNDQLYE